MPTSMVAQEHTEEIEGTIGAGVEGDGRTLPTQTLITCLLTFLMEATARQTAIGNWHTQAISLLLGCLTKGVSTRMYTVFRDLMKPGSCRVAHSLLSKAWLPAREGPEATMPWSLRTVAPVPWSLLTRYRNR